MKTLFKKEMAAIVLLTAALLAAAPSSVQAKAPSIHLNVNQTYKQYDFTGNKKPDKLRISTSSSDSSSYENCQVYLNEKKVLTIKGRRYYSFHINRLELKNKNIYLSIIPVTDNADTPGAAIYQYKGGRFKKAVDLDAMQKISTHNSAKIMKVTGNKITVEHSVMSYALGLISFRLDYQYQNQKLVQTTDKPKLTDSHLKALKKSYWTAGHSMHILKSPSGKRIATLKKGQKAKVNRIYLNPKHTKIYLNVKIKGGKSGWVKGWTSSSPQSSKGMFEEAQYSG